MGTETTQLNDAKTFISPRGLMGKYFYHNGMRVEVLQHSRAQIEQARKIYKNDHSQMRHFILSQSTRVDGKKQTVENIKDMPISLLFKVQQIATNLPIKK